jgi:hypothetical protein
LVGVVVLGNAFEEKQKKDFNFFSDQTKLTAEQK